MSLGGVRKRLTLQLGAELLQTIDKIAEQTGFLHDNGKPRHAELVRVLLVSKLAHEKPVSYRIAVSLYANGIMSISKQLQRMLGSLREEIADVGERWGGESVDLPDHEGDERLMRESPKKYNVYLRLDDWTHNRLKKVYYHAVDYSGIRGGDMVMVRDLLRMALNDFDLHIPVIEGYLGAIGRLEARVGEAVEVERRALSEALAAV